MFFRRLMLLACLCCTALAQSQPINTSQLTKKVAQVIRTPGVIEAAVDQYGVKDPTRQIMIDYLRDIYSTDELLNYIFNSAYVKKALANLPKDTDPIQYGRKIAQELALSLFMKGVTRLSAEDQKEFLTITYEIFKLMPPRECQKAFEEDEASAKHFEEIHYYERLPEPMVRSYFVLFKKAIFAEIRDTPKRKTFSKKEASLAEDAFARTFETYVRKNKIDASVVAAIDNIAAADPKTGCAAGKLLLATVLAMKGQLGEIMVKEMLGE